MTIFDASNRDQCQVGRLMTNTPLQALVLLNDPTILEASRVLAAKLLKEKSDTNEKVYKAFRTIVCRKPNPKEIAILTNFFAQKRKTLTAKSANDLLQIGEYPQDKSLNKVEVAALMQTISIIYNMEETFSKT
jgi:hypothetical protein